MVFFRWILLFVGFCFGLVCCRLAWDFPPFGFSSILCYDLVYLMNI